MTKIKDLISQSIKPTCVLASIFLSQLSAHASDDISTDDCIQNQILTAQDETTIGEIRKRCAFITGSTQEPTIVMQRQRREMSLFGDEFSILLHRDNYLLPLTHNYKNTQQSLESTESTEFDELELKFQFSIKSVLLTNLPLFKGQLYGAYTNQSHWQAYDSERSRPFRETNHQPEIFVDFPSSLRFRNWELNTFRLGLNHQSNGRSGGISRSWNRAFGELEFSSRHNELNLRSWWQISNDDDNPDIDQFMGHFQLGGLHRLGKHSLHWNARKSFSRDGKGAVELGWSRRIGGREDLRLYLQYFEGYGENLIDYNRNVRRLGLGVKIGVN